ncbi:RteC domain-containing protein [Mucilaginibacter sp. dw_454]|uniref:RteC domain-containing protein n=1 Tax=Mucilaginibacter sp. dw_454 TaxID=2720079 RepID=UPI001BD4D958|nr:RteC domain-containing protein [Mucilaginibacter sp. dw_454]
MIFKYADRLYNELNGELTAVKLDEEQRIKMLEGCIVLCIRYLKRLKEFFMEHPPKDKTEEIRFFKEVKPKFKSLLIFYQQVLNIEARTPVGDTELISDFYFGEMKILTHYFERQVLFYEYNRMGSDYLDEKYYVRGVYDIKLGPDHSLVDGDPAFNTSHDNTLAHIMANEMILVWLQKSILHTNNRKESDLEALKEQELITWTETSTALAELVYGLKETKAVNNGNISIERLTRYMERVFHTKLDNAYDTWNYICTRANKTIFMDKMKVALLDRIALKLR